MNKKAEELVTKNALSMIIAVVAILFIGVLLFKLYNFTKDNEAESAKKTLENLVGKIKNLDNGQAGKFVVQGFSSKKQWYLVGFDMGDKIDEKPGKCALDSCICICPDTLKEIGKKCQDEGFCELIGADTEVKVSFHYEKAVIKGTIRDYQIDKFIGNSYNCIPLTQNLIEIITFKNGTNVNMVFNGEYKENYVSNAGCR